jgi:phenylacetate-coenzyme A ligase PaaK-like adenylate-forming protein
MTRPIEPWARWDRAGAQAYQVGALREFVTRHVLPYSAFYRERLARPFRLSSWDDLRRIPLTSKKDLLSTPEHPARALDFVLQPDPAALRRRPDVVWRALWRGRDAARRALEREYRPVFMTSTTGRSSAPVPFLYTQQDLDVLSLNGEHLIAVLGATTSDRILNLFPYAPHLAFWQTHYANLASGIFCLSTGGGKVMGTEANIRLMEKVKPTALIGMPTFLYHLFRQAIEEGHRYSGLRRIVLGGEKVPEGVRQKLRQLCADFGSPGVDVVATYGFTEAKLAWGECPTGHDEEASGYHIDPALALIEIVDPKTGEPVGEGEPGEIVFSALKSRGTVVLRYRTGDCIDGGLVHGPCPHCGRALPRLVGRIARSSEVVEMNLDKLKGTIVDFNALEHLLDSFARVGAWMLEIRKVNDDPMEVDELILHAECLEPGREAALTEEINSRFEEATELRLNQIRYGSLAELRRLQGVGAELKEKRVADHRPREGKPPPPPRIPGPPPRAARTSEIIS